MRRRPVRRRRVGPRFEVVERFRPFEIVAPGFVVVDEPAARSQGLRRDPVSPAAPFVAIEVGLPDRPSAPVVAGLAAENDEHLLGVVDPVRRTAGIEVRTGGVTTVLASTRLRGRVERVAFVVCANEATLLVARGRGWQPVVRERRRIAPRLDLRVPGTLGRFGFAWGTRGRTADVGPVRAGLFGMAGLRDLHLVQHADGAPYTRDGRMHLTATCAGLGFFEQAHWGVFAFDPVALEAGEPIRLEQTAQLYSHRGGLVLGDHAGQLVRDGDRWLVATSSWGDFTPYRGVRVRHTTSEADLLCGVHLLATEPTPLPTTVSSWDPGMTRIDGRWQVSYVESPSQDPFAFHPALAVGPGDAEDWTEGLEPAGRADRMRACEGPVLARPGGPGGPWRLLASDGRARRYPVFDLRLRRVGELDVPYGSNLPHPQLVDLPGGATAMLTFDGTPFASRRLGYGTHGDVIVLRAGAGNVYQ